MKRKRNLWKKQTTVVVVLALILLVACGQNNTSNGDGRKETIRIGYQKSGPILLLKSEKKLEDELGKLGYKVEWSEFNTGASILEALNAGSIDFATAGDTPSVFAASKGMDLKYIAGGPASPSSEGILIKNDSNIKSIKDLKGKRVAYNKASISQYFLNEALEDAGLSMEDVESVYLNPPDASLAFEQGEVDAWVIWDPYLASSESKGNKVLQNSAGIVENRTLFMASSSVIKNDKEVVHKVVEELAAAGQEINEDPTEAASLLSEATNLPEEIWINVLKRKKSDVNYIDQTMINELQRQADGLQKAKLTEKRAKIQQFVWQPDKKTVD
ncbi:MULTISPECIES: aliphatic sulfonate ABC transporter substrate-binding protein [Bacillus]|uniref:Sulfonate transport system substrate-binding protein n=1 Tax=Bacillus capparidis TaxID=1840411 RepID=A0ABS4D2T8_9BACI|nr:MULTISPECIES: aliphatic sulfonate ABC transporter substrate-binding protein [Bacillus]MBP1083915.1 sulfonate transport system substrate-binding protein [Bacillus capparidis]MED1098393.1 aliphatic sulfonate ABC transporter substrate-binding protein [Bacillus capparidis]